MGVLAMRQRNTSMKKISSVIKKRWGLLVALMPLGMLVIYYSLIKITNPASPERLLKPSINPNPTVIKITTAPPKPQTNPPVKYSGNTTKKMLEKLKNRTPLSVNDEAAKVKILSRINNKSSILTNNSIFRVEYIKSPDLFLVEIKTIDIGKGKSDAKNWFMAQGFTPQGACELPVVYYLSPDAASQLRDLGITFSPLTEGC